jgi:hypothetical protein
LKAATKGRRRRLIPARMTYSSATHPPDTEVANCISAALKRRDLKCWIAPRDITPGAHYASEIVHAIDSAKAIVLVSTVRVRSYPRWLLGALQWLERAYAQRDAGWKWWASRYSRTYRSNHDFMQSCMP